MRFCARVSQVVRDQIPTTADQLQPKWPIQCTSGLPQERSTYRANRNEVMFIQNTKGKDYRKREKKKQIFRELTTALEATGK